jgi:glyoxylase-like metal-dependent hydrolase (beta-lactamase superfamily II)
MRKTNRILVGLVAVAALLGAAIIGFRSPLRSWLYAQAMPTSYFSHFRTIAPSLYQVAGPVYAFEAGFTRSLVLRTPEGVAIIDTFSEVHAAAMKEAIARQFPGEPVRWIVFSHNHLDHIRGSTLFAGVEVIGHADVNRLVSDWPVAGQAAEVTRAIAGDQILMLGGVEVRALYMPFSHSQTLYGFLIPSQGVVYAPDMMFVRTLPPFDFPDFYYPGYIRALDRLIALNADHYLPSHAWRGDRDDLIAYRDMTVDFQSTVAAEISSRGVEAPTDGAAMRAALRAAYAKLEPKYGDWHGFEAMFIPKFGRHVGGTYLGY